MKNLALITGLLLIGTGLYSYLAGTPSASTGAVSKTALIPVWIGLAVLIGGSLGALKPAWHKHGMHLAALAALIGAAGSFMPIKRRGLDFADTAVQGATATIVLCVVFLVFAVRSFVVARVIKR
jgi:hypothetical protein